MEDASDLQQQFAALINNSIDYALDGDFIASFRKMREADEFATRHSLEYLWHIDNIQDLVCNHCSRLATTLTDEGSDDVALELLTWQKSIYPSEFHLYYNFGRLAARRGDEAGTILHYERAMQMVNTIEIPPEDLSILVTSLAVAYQKVGETNQAIAFTETEIKNRAWSVSEKEKLQEILAYLKGQNTDLKVVSGREHAIYTARELANRANELDEAGRFNEAQLLYEKAIRLAPDDTYVLYNYGVACAQQNDEALLEKAQQLYRKTIQLDPNYQSAYANLASLSFRKMELADAAKYARRAIELGVQAYALYAILGSSCASLGEFKEARFAYTKALEVAEPRYRPVIEEYLAKLPTEDSAGPEQAPSNATISRGRSMISSSDAKPLRQINADTFPRLGKQFAKAMGKKFVDANYGIIGSGSMEIFFTCHDGNYKAVVPDDTALDVSIYLLDGRKESKVFQIKRE